MKALNVVWLKRDLRLDDHAALAAACEASEPTLLLYVLEPSLMTSDDYGDRHARFIWQSLQDMRRRLADFNLWLYSVYAEVEVIFKELFHHYSIQTVFSYQETGINKTFERDKRMTRFFKGQGISWKEFPTNAVQRGLKNRDGWRAQWKKIINQPETISDLTNLKSASMVAPCREWLAAHKIPERWKTANMLFQPGGEANAWNTLVDFVHGRSRHYNDYISAPGRAPVACSRLSPYITWGNISIRQVWNYVNKYYDDLAWKRPLRSFKSRMRWHCHFIQKFESEPRMEFENLNRGYDDIRKEIDAAKVNAWKQGQTGFPMVDACMRSVKTTGYLNFRMRAMLVSFLTHHLWQPWQAGAIFLGRQFLDFEPGIHYPQFQMQAATIGVNSIRIYNPVKQSYDHDPQGTFIRRWVPELRSIPRALVHEPWRMSRMEQQMYDFEPGITYPQPIIDDIKQSYNRARDVLWEKREQATVQQENKRIVKKHVKNSR